MTAQIAKVATREDLLEVGREQQEVEVLDLRIQSLIARFRALKTKLHRFGILDFWEFVQYEELAYLFRNEEKYKAWISHQYLNVRMGRHDSRTPDFTRDWFKSYSKRGLPEKHNRFWSKYKPWNELFEVEGWNGRSNKKLFWEEIGKKRLADPVYFKLKLVAEEEFAKWKAYRRELWRKKKARYRARKRAKNGVVSRGRPKGSVDRHQRIRNPYAGKSGEIRYDHDHDAEIVETEEPIPKARKPQIEEKCDECGKFAELKNAHNIYTNENLRLCEDCLLSDYRFREYHLH